MREYRKRKLNIRITALLMIAVLMLSVLPVTQVHAADTVKSVVCELVRNNLQMAPKISEVTDDKIWDFVKDASKTDKKWSTVKINDVLEETADEADLEDDWDVQNGSTFAGGQMTKSYSLGDMIYEYEQENNANAVLLKKSEIIDVYDNLTEDDPNVEMSAITKAVNKEAGIVSAGPYNDAEYLEVLNKKNMVTYQQWTRSKGNRIAAGTLFIGTFLIDMNVLNDSIYEYAQASMSKNNQQIMLYKSELDSNSWKDIMSAGSLSDLLPTADSVEEAELMPYTISCVVGADGIPRRPTDNKPINIFDMSDPYDMEQIPELMPLKMLFEGDIVSKSSDDVCNRYNWYMLNYLFNNDRKPEGSKVSQADVDAVLDTTNYSMLFYNLYPNTRKEKGKAEAYVDVLWVWESVGKIPRIYVNDYAIDDWWDFWFGWGGRYVSKGSFPVIRGGVNWKGEKEWYKKWKHRWGEYENHVHRFIRWHGYLYNIQDKKTDKADKQLKALTPVYERFQGEEDPLTAGVIMTLMDKVDSSRRAEAYYNMVLNEKHGYGLGPTFIHFLEAVRDGKTKLGHNFRYFMMGYDGEEYVPQQAIVSAAEDAVGSLQEAYYKYMNRSLVEGTTVLKKREYALSMDIIDDAQKNRTGSIVENARSLNNVYCIEDDSIENRQEELDEIQYLLPQARNEFAARVHDTVSDDYIRARADENATEKTLNSYLEDQKADATGADVGLRELITARCLRINSAQGEQFVNACLDWAEAQRSGISSDAYGTYAREALEEHIKWLQDLLKKVRSGTLFDDDDDSDVDFVTEYEKNLMDALDNDDQEGIQKAFKDLDNALNDSTNKDTAGGESGTGDNGDIDGSDGDGRDLDGDGDDDGGGGGGGNPKPPGGTNVGDSDGPKRVISKIESRVMEHLDDGDEDSLIDGIHALGELGESDEEFDKIEKSARAHGASEEVLQAIDTARETSEDTGLDNGAEKNRGSEGGSDEDGGDAGDGGMSSLTDDQRDMMNGMVESTLGDALANLPDDDKAALVTACERYGTQYNKSVVLTYARGVTESAVAENNPFFYHQFTADPSGKYVSLAAVDKARMKSGMRYVRRGDKVTMSWITRGGSVDVYVGKNEMTRDNGTSGTLNTNVVQQRDVYIHGNRNTKYAYMEDGDCKSLFRITCENVQGTKWAVFAIPSMDEKIEMIFTELETIFET